MFVHAPEKSEITVNTLVLWDDPDLALHAVEICRDIESRAEMVRFQIEEADAGDLQWNAAHLRERACAADIVIVALHRTICELPGSVKDWFLDWSGSRERQAGALAVLRAADHVDCEQFRNLLQEIEERYPACSESEQNFRHFLERCANRAHMEFFWGCLESDLAEATRGMRVFEAPEVKSAAA